MKGLAREPGQVDGLLEETPDLGAGVGFQFAWIQGEDRLMVPIFG